MNPTIEPLEKKIKTDHEEKPVLIEKITNIYSLDDFCLTKIFSYLTWSEKFQAENGKSLFYKLHKYLIIKLF